MAFAYEGDVGVLSYTEIIVAAMASGLIGSDPLLRDTNDLDHDGQGSYHDTGNAVDFGDDAPNGSPQQDAFAQWVAHNFGPYSLELIHTYPGNSGGVYWKRGQIVDGESFYGDATVQAHRNHVHWAITLTGIAAGMASFGVDIMTTLPTINTAVALDMQDPVIRTAMALLGARGMWITPNNGDHAVFTTALKAFHITAGMPDNGLVDQPTWQALVRPLKGK